MKLYKMKDEFISQSWYDKESVYKLIKIFYEKRIRQFGVDCLWENIETGIRFNHWDAVMTEIDIQESRDIKLKMII